MTLNIFNSFEASGEPEEIATYTFLVLEWLKYKSNERTDQKESEFLRKYGHMTFEELRRMEMGEDMEE